MPTVCSFSWCSRHWYFATPLVCCKEQKQAVSWLQWRCCTARPASSLGRHAVCMAIAELLLVSNEFRDDPFHLEVPCNVYCLPAAAVAVCLQQHVHAAGNCAPPALLLRSRVPAASVCVRWNTSVCAPFWRRCAARRWLMRFRLLHQLSPGLWAHQAVPRLDFPCTAWAAHISQHQSLRLLDKCSS